MYRLLKSVLVFIAALIILFEEWLWEPLKQLMLALSQLPFLKQLAVAIGGLSPYSAALIYLGPMILLVPFKIGGLWLVAQGHVVLGLVTFLTAKVMGTALFAWLFNLTKPALLQISWFAKGYAAIHAISETAHAWLRQQYLYQWLRAAIREIRTRISRFAHRRD